MKTYIIYGSLWNFDTKFGKENFKLGDFIIKKVKRPSVKLEDFQRVHSCGLPKEKANFLTTLLFIYQVRKGKDFPNFIIQCELIMHKSLDFSSADKKIKYLLTSLRLYQDGNVLGRFISGVPKKQFKGELIPLDFDSYYNSKNKYILDSAEKFEEFLTTLDGLENLIDSVAIDRFNISYHHYNSPIERLLDLIIVLESLFNKTSYDVRFKTSLRASHLLYPERSEKRQETYENINSAYKLRNAIVHGLRPVTAPEAEKTIDNLYPIVRKVLLSAINLRKERKLDLFKKGLEESTIDKVIINT